MTTLYESDDDNETTSSATSDNDTTAQADLKTKAPTSNYVMKFAKFFCLNAEDDKAQLQINRAPRRGGRTTG